MDKWDNYSRRCLVQSISGKVAIVTGASSGIGAATARLLAGEGCRVVLAARSADKLQALAEELGDGALAVATDVTKGSDVTQLVERCIEAFGKVDILFANAGIYFSGKVSECEPEAWEDMLNININGVIRCAQAVLPHMISQQGGDIVVTSSISGVLEGSGEPFYGASKHAIKAFTHILRNQVASEDIRVGVIAPGTVANELWGITEPEKIEERVAAQNCLRSEDVANAVLFMLTQPANVAIRDLVMMPQKQTG
jgi:ribitol 2-dehydrogenase